MAIRLNGELVTKSGRNPIAREMDTCAQIGPERGAKNVNGGGFGRAGAIRCDQGVSARIAECGDEWLAGGVGGMALVIGEWNTVHGDGEGDVVAGHACVVPGVEKK